MYYSAKLNRVIFQRSVEGERCIISKKWRDNFLYRIFRRSFSIFTFFFFYKSWYLQRCTYPEKLIFWSFQPSFWRLHGRYGARLLVWYYRRFIQRIFTKITLMRIIFFYHPFFFSPVCINIGESQFTVKICTPSTDFEEEKIFTIFRTSNFQVPLTRQYRRPWLTLFFSSFLKIVDGVIPY